MENKYLFGSKMLKLENPRDEDWLIFVNGRAADIKEKNHRSIPFYNRIIARFIEGKNNADNGFKALYLYQLSAPFINDANYPFNHFNILEHKQVWIAQLKGYINREETEQYATKNELLPKQFYHLLYQYYMITENVHFISAEAKAKVQKIHDLEMPSSYFYELREMINSL
jgi:hypothetical protein